MVPMQRRKNSPMAKTNISGGERKICMKSGGFRDRVKKAQFVTILLLCTSILLFQSMKCIIKFREKSTGTGDKYVDISKTSFPVMSICPTYPYKLDILQDNGLETLTSIQFGASWISNHSGVSPTEFYEKVVHSAHELINHIIVYTAGQMDGSNIFERSKNLSICGQNLFEAKPYYFNGNCYAIVMPQCLLDIGILEVVLGFNMDKTDIFIHHPGQFLSPNSRYTPYNLWEI